MKARLAGILLGVMTVTCWGTHAWALPGEWALGGELGGGRSTRTTWSPSLGFRAAYGLAEAFDVQLDLSGQWRRYEGTSTSDDDALFRLVPALSYKWDVVRWIPFVRVGAGPALAVPVQSDQAARVSAALQGALGVEYLVDRSLSWGFAYQADWLIGGNPAPLAPMHRLLLTVLWRSGW